MGNLKKRYEISSEELKAFQSHFSFDPKISELLISRGINSPEKIADYFNPDYKNTFDPFLFSGMSSAVKRINSAIENKENIVIYGDYDCDGISSIAILYLALKNAGAYVWYYIPDRHNEGYGLNIDAVERIAERCFPDLLITVDCGITSVSEIHVIQEEMGIDVIVSDHHSLKPEIPDCTVINPKLDMDKNAPDLCGAGVALKLVEALFGREIAENYIDLAGIATIADMVELKGDNRIIASLSIKMINEGKTQLGLNMLARKVASDNKPLTVSDIAFKIAPRLNASGRISSAEKALELFLTNDRNEIVHILNELERDNFERQQMMNDVISHAKEMLYNMDLSDIFAIVLYSPLWDAGVVGIAAAKIAEEFMRPTILLTSSDGGLLKGSARSIKNVDLLDALENSAGFLNSYGGHKAAAGVTIFKDNLENFSKSLSEYIKNNYSLTNFEKTIIYDLKLDYKDITLDFVNGLSLFEPFGIGNPRPLFISDAPSQPFMKMKSGEHYRVRIDGKRELVAFNFKEGIDLLNLSNNVTLAYYLEKEIFQNREYIKGIVKDAILLENDFDNDYLCALALEQIKFSDCPYSTFSSVNEIDIKPFGTLFVAFSKETYIKYVSELNLNISGLGIKQSDITRIHIGSLSSVDFRLFNNIVFLEKPLCGGFIEAIKDKIKAKIYVVNNENPLTELLKKEAPQREDVLNVFLKLKSSNEKLYFDGLGSLYNKLFKDKSISFIKFSACVHILFELKLLLVYNNLQIEISSNKSDLNKSNVYRYLNNL